MPKLDRNYVGTKEIKNLIRNPHYARYWEKRKQLLEEYPPFSEMDRDTFRVWLNDITNLMYEQDGDFQKFIWDNISEDSKMRMEKRARGRVRSRDY